MTSCTLASMASTSSLSFSCAACAKPCVSMSKTGQKGSDLNDGECVFAVGILEFRLLLLTRHILHEGERRKQHVCRGG
jgi:hypothetical protein